MRLPKTVTIYGKQYKIIKDPTRNGASVAFDKDEITIGTIEKGNIINNLFHEVIELLLAENHHRYENHHLQPDRNDIIFIFNHTEFENLIPQIVFALKDVIKDKKND